MSDVSIYPYQLKFSAHNGFSHIILQSEDYMEVRKEAAAYIKHYRNKGISVHTLEAGAQWETETPENREGLAVTDQDGILCIIFSEPPDREWDEDWDTF